MGGKYDILFNMHTGKILIKICSFLFAVYLITFHASAAEPSTEKNQYWGTVSDKTAQILKGGCDTDPYKILLSKYTPGPQSAKEGQAGIMKLNSDFACRLSKFITKFPSICIKSAYRSVETQKVLWDQALAKYGSEEAARKWVAPPGSSMHNKGLAADLCNVPDSARSAAAADKLTFRMGHEPWHIEPSGAVNGSTPDGNSAEPPSSAISNMFRKALGLNQQPQQPPPPTPPIPPQQQALPQQQQSTQYFPTQSGSGGSTGGSGQSPVSALSPTSQQYLGVIGGGSQPPTSIADHLLQLAYGTSSSNPPQNTGTTVPLFLNAHDTGTLQTQEPVTQQIPNQAQNNVPIGSIQPPQTFTSPDLSYAPGAQQNTFAQKPTGMYAILEAMKQTLLRALEILRPMGIRAALQGEHTHVDEYAE